MSERCFSASEIAENPEVKCKSGSTLEDFGHLPADKNYCQIQPDQSIGEKTWAECDKDCPTATNHGITCLPSQTMYKNKVNTFSITKTSLK